MPSRQSQPPTKPQLFYLHVGAPKQKYSCFNCILDAQNKNTAVFGNSWSMSVGLLNSEPKVMVHIFQPNLYPLVLLHVVDTSGNHFDLCMYT